jgi:hypothetical protein
VTVPFGVGKWGHHLNLRPPTPAEQATADAARAELDAASPAAPRRRTDDERVAPDDRTGADPCSS